MAPEFTRRDLATIARKLGLTAKQKAIAVAVLVDGHSGPQVAFAHGCVHQYVYKVVQQVRTYAKRDPRQCIKDRIAAILAEYEKEFPKAVAGIRRELVKVGLAQLR